MIPRQIEERIKNYARGHILEVVQSFVPALKKRGQNWFALSPFKAENTPSFAVHPGKGIWKCFATGAGGDAIQFLIDAEGMSYPDALRWIADQAGIEFVEGEGTQEERQEYADLEEMRIAASWAKDVFQEWGTVSDYWQTRGISAAMIEKFALGDTFDEWDALVQEGNKQGRKLPTLQDCGLVTRSGDGRWYDKYRARAIFPIHDALGRVVGFGGRIKVNDPKAPKYINSPESPLYRKSKVLYGLHLAKAQIRREGYAVLCEGYTDVIALHQAAEETAVASCGTAVTEAQLRQLQRFANRLVLAFDGDDAGAAAIWKVLKAALPLGFSVEIAGFTAGEDPDSLREEGGDAALRAAIANRTGWVDHLLRTWNSLTAELRATLVSDISALIALIPHELEREVMAQELARKTSLSADAVLAEVFPERTSRDSESVDPLDGPATWSKLQYICQQCGVPMPHDFEKEGEKVRVSYFNLKNDPCQLAAKEGVKAKPFTRIVGERGAAQAIYLPPGLRLAFQDTSRVRGGGVPLFICPDEITAMLLDQIGLYAIGLPWPMGFLQSRGGKKAHKLLKAVLAAFEFKQVVYLAPGEMWRLPAPSNPSNPHTAYNMADASETAKKYVDTFVRLRQAIPDQHVHVAFAPSDASLIDRTDDAWIERLLVDALGAIPDWRKKVRSDLVEEFRDCIHPDARRDLLQIFNISDATKAAIQKLFALHDAQAFFEAWGGFEVLGEQFQFGGMLYDVDREGQVALSDVAKDRLPVYEEDGQYWALTKTGAKRISNFKIEPQLKILGRKPTVLATLCRGDRRFDIAIDSDTLLSADKFHLLAFGRGELVFKGTNSHLREMQEMVFRGTRSAHKIEKLGWVNMPAAGYDGFFALGDGMVNGQGFQPVDEKGLVDYYGDTLFLPAYSSFTGDDDAKQYALHRGMSWAANNEVTMREFLDQAFETHGNLWHHLFSFSVASLFRDFIYEKMTKFPLLYLQGETGTGKSTAVSTMKYLFGGTLPEINFENRPSIASVGSLPRQAANVPCIVKEYNVFKLANSGGLDLVNMVKGWYDGTSRATRLNAQTQFLNNEVIDGTIVAEGQEPFYTFDEAVNNRFVVIELQQRDFDVASLNRMKLMQTSGLTHIVTELLAHRPLLKEKFLEAQLGIEGILKSRLKGKNILARLVENWAIMLTPLLILIRDGKIDYPLSIKQILDDAVERIEQHASKAVQQGIVSEFWDFVETMWMKPGWLDDRNVFVHEKSQELRIHFNSTYQLFVRYLNQKGDKAITPPTKGNFKKKLKDPTHGFKGESNKTIGWKRETSASGHLNIVKREAEKGKWVPVADKGYCMQFALESLDFRLPQPTMLDEWSDLENEKGGNLPPSTPPPNGTPAMSQQPDSDHPVPF